jgi:hypothetical protein
MFTNTRGIRQGFLYQLCCLSCQWKSWLQDLETIKILRDSSMLSLLCLSFPTQIPPVLFLFINNPEKDPKVSISLNAIYISSLDVQNKVVSSEKPIKTLGVYFGNNKEDCEKLNWENKIDKMNTLFFSWGKRNLTILGKIMIIKALVIPIFTLNNLYFFVFDIH